MTVYRIRFVGPASLAIQVATALADADGVDLISSAPPSNVNKGTVALELEVEGSLDVVTAAVSSIGDALADGASIEIADD